jgi:glycosyltransferase involved in cell wall biosynthesis
VPVIASALHSTGWPDSVGKLNRLLTPITDAFIGVADSHGRHLVEREHFPAAKVHVIHNGVDTDRFTPGDKQQVRSELALPADAKVIAILAALRPEKNHEFFLRTAAKILAQEPKSQFLVIGDGALRSSLEVLARELGIEHVTHFLGSRPDVDRVLTAVDVLALTSHNEASPVSILEALSCGVPAVAANVGSVSETVIDNVTGKLFPTGDEAAYIKSILELITDEPLRTRLGATGRQQVIEQRSLSAMVTGYESLLSNLHHSKTKRTPATSKRRLSQTPLGAS